MSRESTIRDLRAKIRQWEVQKRRIDEELAAMHTALRVFENMGVQMGGQDEVTSRHSSYSIELTNAIHDILVHERPLHRSTIRDRVEERGIYVGGTNPINSIGSYLSIDDRFKNVGRGLWTLTEEPTSHKSGPRIEHHDELEFDGIDNTDVEPADQDDDEFEEWLARQGAQPPFNAIDDDCISQHRPAVAPDDLPF